MGSRCLNRSHWIVWLLLNVNTSVLSGDQNPIQGKILTVDILVDTTNSTKPPLAGRQLLIAAFDVGFNVSNWLSIYPGT